MIPHLATGGGAFPRVFVFRLCSSARVTVFMQTYTYTHIFKQVHVLMYIYIFSHIFVQHAPVVYLKTDNAPSVDVAGRGPPLCFAVPACLRFCVCSASFFARRVRACWIGRFVGSVHKNSFVFITLDGYGQGLELSASLKQIDTLHHVTDALGQQRRPCGHKLMQL